MANPNGRLREELCNAMVAADMSARELTRVSGFLRHQIDNAIAGHAKISAYTYTNLMRHVGDYQSARNEKQGDD